MMFGEKSILVQHKLCTVWRLAYLLTIIWLASHHLSAQNVLDWDVLADVTFEEKYDEDLPGYILFPTFGEVVESYENKVVSLEGYLINLDLDYTVVILSLFPYSSCFFCGMAGPETIVEIQLKDPINHIKPDQRASIQGRLILNADDLDHFNYILQNAEIKLLE